MSSEEETENEKLAREWKENEEKKAQQVAVSKGSTTTIILEKTNEEEKENRIVDKVAEKLLFEKSRAEICTKMNVPIESIKNKDMLKELYEAYEEMREKKPASTVPLTRAQEGSYRYVDKSVDIADREYSSYQEMLEDIEEEAKNPESPHQKDAMAYLDALADKFRRTPQSVEFFGSLVKSVSKQTFPKGAEEEAKLSEEMRKLERSKWRKK